MVQWFVGGLPVGEFKIILSSELKNAVWCGLLWQQSPSNHFPFGRASMTNTWCVSHHKHFWKTGQMFLMVLSIFSLTTPLSTGRASIYTGTNEYSGLKDPDKWSTCNYGIIQGIYCLQHRGGGTVRLCRLGACNWTSCGMSNILCKYPLLCFPDLCENEKLVTVK